ncbi:hypothetical protein [Magnetospirillum sp. UT-4]|uniref:DUF6414 family protein n=1 Tax=Magnetospirillum sp. UT-4 TaxID=2681467 RepID=UPI001382A17C|nr:hypothetical protein [Magnetospirillum sp. UT-4]CAA7622501.1 conserved hypothetical protein [Magnetospirillum sp. UT-4]
MEPALPITEFLYDFTYLDRERVHSHFAQLFPDGLLTQIKRAQQTGEKGEARVKASALVASGNAIFGESTLETLERQYDAAWTLPITLLDRLDELSFLHRDLGTAPLGQLVLIRGALQLLDIRMLQSMWDLIARLMEREARQSGNRQSRRRGQDTGNELASFKDLAEIIKKIPHPLQMNFLCGDDLIWSTLSAEKLTMPPDDFALKHSSVIPGEWHMLAVLDARPDTHDVSAADAFAGFAAMGSGLTSGVMQMLDGIRNAVGRPAFAFGVTPLMIFRAVRPKSS